MAANNILENINDLLGFGPTNLIGVDVGYSSIKVCELSIGKNSFKLNKFASIPMPEGALIEDEIQKHDEIVEKLKQVIKESAIKNKNASFGIFGPNTIAKRLQLAAGALEDIEDQVMWESEQYIPFGVEDSTVDFHVIGENAGGGTDVLIAAARNDIVDAFKILLEDAGLRLKAVDLQLFSINNVFEFVLESELKKHPKDVYCLIDFGAQKTNLIVYQNNSILFTKEINVGGIIVTEEIQRSMGLSFLEAEDLKINGDNKGNLPKEIVEIINSLLETFLGEIKKSLNFVITAASIDAINHCYITGGNSLLPGLAEGLEGLLGIKAQYLNPFEKFTFNNKAFDEATLNYVATHGGVALGLAMRKIAK